MKDGKIYKNTVVEVEQAGDIQGARVMDAAMGQGGRS